MAEQHSQGPGRQTRVYLDVPYREKDDAKAAGARWDPRARRWYDPQGPTAALSRWAAQPDVPELLPGEDRTFGSGLFVDLVPRSCWFTNVRSCVADGDWERLRRPILRRASYRCEACSAGEDQIAGRGLEVHERWYYDHDRGVQALRRLITLCPMCHTATHYGRAEITGQDREAFVHLRTVTGMSDGQTYKHIDDAKQLWAARSARVWELDLSVLTDVGITVRRPPAADERAVLAERELEQVRTADVTPIAPAVSTPRPPTGAMTPPVRTRSAGQETDAAALAAALAGTSWHGGPDDLALHASGIGVSHEAVRRRQVEGLGSDRSWRVGADGEVTVAEVVSTLMEPSWLDRLRGRAPAWRVLHSVPIGTGRADIDHVVIGPPGVVTINAKHHKAGRVCLDGDELIVNGRRTDYIPKARREAYRAAVLLGAALNAIGHNDLAAQLKISPMIAVVGGRVVLTNWARGVGVVMPRQLTFALNSMSCSLNTAQVDVVYEVARHRATWARDAPDNV